MKNVARALALVIALAALIQTDVATAEVSDVRPPSVTILSPLAGTAAEGVLTVAGVAKDSFGVKKVQVRVAGGRYRRAIGTKVWRANIDTSAYLAGPQKVRVRATDRNGNRRVRSVWVNIADQGQGSRSMTTPEGAKIEITSAGSWTAERIHQMLVENGLNDQIGPSLTVKVQDSVVSQASTSASGVGTRYTSFSATIYLQGRNSSFASSPDAVLAHEFGHVWTLYHLYLAKQGDWSSYLQARGLAGHPKLDTEYSWDRKEIIADDYRLLFSSQTALGQWPTHMNRELPDPRQVAGLREFFTDSWSAPV
jgi:hypothetical protein